MPVPRDSRPLEPAPFDESALDRLPAAATLASDPLVVNPLDPEFAAPALTNQWSGLVAGRDPLSYLGLSSPELFHEGPQAELFIGVNGAPLVPASAHWEELMYQWHPSSVHRAAESEGLAINVNTALSVTDQAVLSRLLLHNTSGSGQRVDLFIRMHADLRTEWDMSWPPPEFAEARIEREGTRVRLTAPDGQATAVLGALSEPVAVASFNRNVASLISVNSPVNVSSCTNVTSSATAIVPSSGSALGRTSRLNRPCWSNGTSVRRGTSPGPPRYSTRALPGRTRPRTVVSSVPLKRIISMWTAR